MHSEILLFMIQVLVVLALARTLGELCRRYKQPPLAGEILAGILLGQTVLGHLSPGLFGSLFPADPNQLAMYGVVAEIGILFLLLVVGLEVNVSSAWKMRGKTLGVAITGVLVPLAMGTGVAWVMYGQWQETEAPRFAFALLVGAGISITAITVVARLLFDMKIIKSDLGLFLVSAMALNELLGWVVLAVVLGLVGAGASGDGINVLALAGTLGGVLAFAAFCMTIGRWLATRGLLWLEDKGLPSPGVPLSVVVCLGLLGGVVAGSLGIHPVFGFLLAGMMAGDPRALSEHTRSIISQMVESIFVPLFFAGICLRVDFATQFDLTTVLVVTALSVGGKFVGAWLGTIMVKLPITERIPVGIAHIPGGPMGVLLAEVAKETNIIGEKMFVALVVASIVSALLVGPGFVWALGRGRKQSNVRRFFRENWVVSELGGRTPAEVISELAEVAGTAPGTPSAEIIAEAVLSREQTMKTGVGDELAVPHARLEELDEALVVFGASKEGVDWDSVDGRAAHLVFLVLTPKEEADTQLEILAVIAKAFLESDARRELIAAPNAKVQWARLQKRLDSAAP